MPRLNDQEKLEEAARRAGESLDKLAPGLREKIHGEKFTKLPADQRRAWEKPKDKRSDAETALAAEADGQLFVGNDEVARRVTGANRREALRLAEQANHDTELANIIRRDRSHVNFVFWRTRAEMEQTPDALAGARRSTTPDTPITRPTCKPPATTTRRPSACGGSCSTASPR